MALLQGVTGMLRLPDDGGAEDEFAVRIRNIDATRCGGRAPAERAVVHEDQEWEEELLGGERLDDD